MIRVRAGTYAGQTVNSGTEACSDSTRIVIRPESNTANTFVPGAEPNAEVVLTGSLSVTRRWTTVMDMDLPGSQVSASVGSGFATMRSFDIRFERLDSERWNVKGYNVTVVGGSGGGFDACSDGAGGIADVFNIGRGSTESRGITITGGWTGHDLLRTVSLCNSISPGEPADHADIIQFFGVADSLIDGIRLYNYPNDGILGRPQTNAPVAVLQNLTIRNVMANPGPTGAFNYINIGSPTDNCTGVVLEYNSGKSGIDFECSGSTGNFHRGNIATSYGIQNSSGSFNIGISSISGAGPNSFLCTPTWLASSQDQLLGDLHLASADTCARSRGNPANHPASDYDGETRPQGVVDAGADELP